MTQKNEMTMEIEGTIYILSTYYSEGDETIIDKITRLVQEDESVLEKL